MEWYYALLLIVGGLALLMMTGLPIAFCFLGINLAGVYIFQGGQIGIEQLAVTMFGSLSTFALLPLPLFILMGELIAHSAFASDMLNSVDQWLGRLPGRLSFVAVIGGVLVATLTGTNVASVSLLGDVLLPEMKKRRYMTAMSVGPILGSSCLAMMIPPSAPAVIWGAIAEVSVGKLLIAIIVPGLLMTILYTVYILVRCALQPSLAPTYEAPKVATADKLKSFIFNILPVAFIIFMVVGIMFLGIAGPSEAAATGALGTLLVCALIGKISWGSLRQAIYSTTKITIMMFMIMMGSKAFSQILAFTGASVGFIEFLTGFSISPMITLIIMQIILLILGCLMDAVSIMMITLPIFMPIVKELGFDPVWFGVIFLINVDLSGLTPPFGLSLFTMKGVAPNFSMREIINAAIPFVLLDLMAMGLIMIFPSIALWLPSVMR